MSDALAWAQIVATVLIAATLAVYFFQLVAMRQASSATNLIAIIDFIQRPSHSDARALLMAIKSPLGEWSTEQRRTAERACSAWDSVGLLLLQSPAAQQPVLETWYSSILNCHDKAYETGLVLERRKIRGRDFWKRFDWLAQEARRYRDRERD